MTGWQILGGLILLVPFAGLGIFSVMEFGWRVAAVMWASVFGLVAVVLVGSFLVAGDLP